MTSIEDTISELRTVTEKIQAVRMELTKLNKEERKIKGQLLKTAKSEPVTTVTEKPQAEKQKKKAKRVDVIPRVTFD